MYAHYYAVVFFRTQNLVLSDCCRRLQNDLNCVGWRGVGR